MSIIIQPEVPLPTKITPDYSPGVSITITAQPPRPAASIQMNTQVSLSDSEYSDNYTFNPAVSDEATEADLKYPDAWDFYFNNGTTYTTLPHSVERAKQLSKAINFYLYNRTDRETADVEFNSSGDLVDKGHEKFQAPIPAEDYVSTEKPLSETLLSELYYGTDQIQGNTNKTRMK